MEIKKSNSDTTPASRSRLTGLVYLLYFITAIIAESLHNIPILYIGFNLIAFSFYIALSLLFYYLFKPVNKALSLVAAVFSLLGCLLGVLGLFHLDVYAINPLLFFGPYCILIGYLTWRSSFLPRLLGVLLIAAGIGWLFFLMPLPKFLSVGIQVLGILSEGILMLWLLIRGVNEKAWIAEAEH